MLEFYSNSDKCLKLKTDSINIKIVRYDTESSENHHIYTVEFKIISYNIYRNMRDVFSHRISFS